MSSTPHTYDVLICGGGPVGLVLAYQLARFGISTCTVERLDKAQYGYFGHAGCYYPRSLEMLDQLGLSDAIHQMGFITRQGATFRDGQRVAGRGWNFLGNMTDTFMDYAILLRQKFSEDIFREALVAAGGSFRSQTALQSFAVESDANSEHPVSSTVAGADGATYTIRSRYLIGADGGKSTVRTLAGIPFEGQETEHRWVRMDAIVRTDMPHARLGVGAVESSTHGSLLWAPNDHGRTRVGYTVFPELYEKYNGSLTLEDAIYEAKQAIRPFTLEFESVDWFSVYTIRQRLAAQFWDRGRVLLAGDAAHTHSSAAAQGMNTGIHDAVNLAWKLAGVLKGSLQPAVLDTYEAERLPVGRYLIKTDKTISTLASGKDDANVLYARFFEENANFTSGLGVYYEANNILNKETPILNVAAGRRGPDTLVRRPGSVLPVRLYEITKNVGKYWIVVFAGDPLHTKQSLHALREYLDSDASFTHRLADVFEFCTIIAASGRSGQAVELLGMEGFGYCYYDPEESAHLKYGVSTYQGAVVCLRPDGIVGFAVTPDEGLAMGQYFDAIVAPKQQSTA